MVKGGKLVFKGEKPKSKKKSKKIKVAASSSQLEPASANPAAAREQEAGKPASDQPKIVKGKGTITTSSNVVSGYGTAFNKQLHQGDAIMADGEMRVVKMVLSPVSISISSAFSSDLRTPTEYQYISKPRDVASETANKLAKKRREQEEIETRAMGTYGAKNEIVYRERTEHGSYRIKREQATTDMTRSDLLSYRASKKSDRYC